jgi:hypothetical protein
MHAYYYYYYVLLASWPSDCRARVPIDRGIARVKLNSRAYVRVLHDVGLVRSMPSSIRSCMQPHHITSPRLPRRPPHTPCLHSPIDTPPSQPHCHSEALVLGNKAPRWHVEHQNWCLNFHGRVTMASVKNF